MGGNWGSIPTGRSRGSRPRRILLSIASVVLGVALVWLNGELGIASDPSITSTVLTIVALLVAGVIVGLRPWSPS